MTVGLNLPWGIAVSDDGSQLLVADSNNLLVWRRSLTDRAVDVVAGGDPTAAAPSARAVPFRYPCGLAFRRDGSFYVADNKVVSVGRS